MAIGDNIPVLNKEELRKLKRALHKLPITMKSKVLGFGTKAAASVIKKRARARVPVGKGVIVKGRKKRLHLRDTIRIAKFRDPNRNKVTYIVHAGKGRRTAHLIEFGTDSHTVKGRAMKIGNKWINKYTHPGSAPKPFMRPALDGPISEPIEAMRKKINERLEKIYGVQQ